jgi:acyl carrier protein
MEGWTMELVTTIREFIIDNFLFGDAGDLVNDASLLDAGIIDSTGILELVAFLEEQFSIRIEDEEMIPENLDSVDHIFEFITRKSA